MLYHLIQKHLAGHWSSDLKMVFTIVNSIEFIFRKYKNMKMAIWHITTHFVVEGHISSVSVLCLAVNTTLQEGPLS